MDTLILEVQATCSGAETEDHSILRGIQDPWIRTEHHSSESAGSHAPATLCACCVGVPSEGAVSECAGSECTECVCASRSLL